MRINAWVEKGTLGEDIRVVRELVQVPVGHFAVIVTVQEERPNAPLEYLHNDESDRLEIITPVSEANAEPEVLILKHSEYPNAPAASGPGWSTEGTHIVQEKLCFHAPFPFVVKRTGSDIWGNVTVELARQVTPQGLGPLPEFPLPSFHKSSAGVWGPRPRKGKWARLSELATMVGRSTQDLLKHFEPYFGGYMKDGILFLRSDDSAELETFEKVGRAWSAPDKKALIDGDHDDLWVSKFFCLVVLYIHHLGRIPSKTKASA